MVWSLLLFGLQTRRKTSVKCVASGKTDESVGGAYGGAQIHNFTPPKRSPAAGTENGMAVRGFCHLANPRHSLRQICFPDSRTNNRCFPVPANAVLLAAAPEQAPRNRIRKECTVRTATTTGFLFSQCTQTLHAVLDSLFTRGKAHTRMGAYPLLRARATSLNCTLHPGAVICAAKLQTCSIITPSRRCAAATGFKLPWGSCFLSFFCSCNESPVSFSGTGFLVHWEMVVSLRQKRYCRWNSSKLFRGNGRF